MSREISPEMSTDTNIEENNVNNSSNDTDQADAILPALLNHNKYASKKTLANGMLDLALLSANAAQLKFIIANWKQYEFHTLLLSLIATSIILQVVQAVVCIVLGLIFDINHVNDHKAAEIINNVSLAISVVVVAINVIISVIFTGLSEETHKPAD